MTERAIKLGVYHSHSGLDFDVTRKGIYLGGYYDSFVGIEGRFIPWEALDEARRKVMSKESLD